MYMSIQFTWSTHKLVFGGTAPGTRRSVSTAVTTTKFRYCRGLHVRIKALNVVSSVHRSRFDPKKGNARLPITRILSILAQ
ncbi:hypothetical protein EGR_10556 [Echinococcus granulosus]|uniref:Uncharacterized protein n=1 Tax=Echinococcus granulosus TaxID=6210 RepID=W6U871_ECHGR|nr:hypothetical protein EGR_10556 [Echinococcus granulosus]EUB54587.1 hypothetical protein EGR_10556 [Echinococcus granulosus]